MILQAFRNAVGPRCIAGLQLTEASERRIILPAFPFLILLFFLVNHIGLLAVEAKMSSIFPRQQRLQNLKMRGRSVLM